MFRSDLDCFRHSPLLTSKEFTALRDCIDLFEDVAAIVEANGSLASTDDMAPLNAAAASDTFFETLGGRRRLPRVVAVTNRIRSAATS